MVKSAKTVTLSIAAASLQLTLLSCRKLRGLSCALFGILNSLILHLALAHCCQLSGCWYILSSVGLMNLTWLPLPYLSQGGNSLLC